MSATERNIEERGERKSLNFIEQIIEEHNKSERFNQKVHTRFPPEPNGYLHIGHAKSICLNFGLANKYNGKCNLRFDDTNPATEDVEYVDSIREDVHWLGFDWQDREFYASDYFGQLYDFACSLIKKGLAYVDDQPSDEIARQKGTPTQPGTESPFRSRTPEENLDLFERMKNGEFAEGSKILRAKIDMSSPNMHMRDPAIYRIRKTPHHRTGGAWNIYPMYDFAHGLSDSIEGITHSICTLEFEVHRPLYEWINNQLVDHKPQQIEFARLNLSYTVMSKRKLKELVEGKYVKGWDDPRMPTICGLRRRGYTPESIRNFSERIGVARRDGIIDLALLEHSIREDLNRRASRVMSVLDPLKVTLVNYPENYSEEVKAINNPEDPEAGTRNVTFTHELYIEREDFMENPPKKFFRLSPGGMVRLKYAYIIKCLDVVKDDHGNIIELKCEYIPESKSGNDTSNIKVKGTLHWVSIAHSQQIEVRIYDRLFMDEEPDGHKDKDFKDFLNPESLKILKNCFLEQSVNTVDLKQRFQFERKGYFCHDKDSSVSNPVFNLTVPLRDSWAKISGNVN
ncbi:MAG: glutamine--tRNA ligase/YqeY domain fusion protein [Cyclobacteriaceae bacterium]|nr:glutamine--tRNA ligase/YqeY domain fusion protein [Cyclobacteriaceae bacterium]